MSNIPSMRHHLHETFYPRMCQLSLIFGTLYTALDKFSVWEKIDWPMEHITPNGPPVCHVISSMAMGGKLPSLSMS